MSPDSDRSPIPVKILISGGFGAGKTTAIAALSDIPPLTTEGAMTTAALAVDEGVDRWLVELLGAEPTEAMFLGAIGTALSPGQIRGFQSFGEHPDMPWLLSRRHYLGEVEVFDAFRSMTSRAVMSRGAPGSTSTACTW